MTPRIVMIISLYLALTAAPLPVGFFRMPECVPQPTQTTSGSASKEGASRDFTEVLMGERITREGIRYPFHTWKTKDGTTVSSSVISYRSTNEAKKVFSDRLEEAISVIEKGYRPSETGQRLVRTILLLQYKPNAKKYIAIIWIDGATIFSIESYSLDQAKRFEQEFYPPPTDATPSTGPLSPVSH